jgi:hypothetical protein
MTIQSTLNSIRKSIEEESVSYDEIIQLQHIAFFRPHLFAGDPRLAELAGISEEEYRCIDINFGHPRLGGKNK